MSIEIRFRKTIENDMFYELYINGIRVCGFYDLFAIFAGLALAISITTRVYTWVTSLGN